MKKSNLIKPLALAASAGLLVTACSSTRSYNDRDYSNYPSSSQNQRAGEYSSWEQSSVAAEGSGAQQRSQKYSSSQERDQISIPLHEERLNVGKQTVESGQVTFRKIVTTETVNQPIQLRKESLVIDRDHSGSQNTASTRQDSSEWKPGAENDSDKDLSASAKAGSAQAKAELQNQANEPAGASYSESRPSTSTSSSGTAFQEETFTIRLQEEKPMVQKNVVQTGIVTARKDSKMQSQNISQQVRREDVKLDRSGAQNVEIRGNFNTAGGTINEPSGAERNQSSESIQKQSEQNQSQQFNRGENRVPTQGQGARDLKQLDQQNP